MKTSNVEGPAKDRKYDGFRNTRRPFHRNGKPANMTGRRTEKFSPRGRKQDEYLSPQEPQGMPTLQALETA